MGWRIFVTVLWLGWFWLVGSVPATAANLRAVVYYTQTHRCRGCDLSRANLMARDLSWSFLLTANLQQADLRGSNLSHSNLSWARLNGVELRQGNLSASKLLFANLQGANLQGVNFQGANLNSADLRGADVQGVNWRDADVNFADLRGAHSLSVADFQKAQNWETAMLDPEVKQ
ncbi:MAG TPA: pentapeptide repeat-containing protein [Cyanobacteria bacterium UBA8156]|jgi:uncharacterized protein YjbI with pentapeptide repeats|nr:pentapeptide repeat-containing protein [Cyanobacteria bacterium UBA8156]